MVKKTTWKKCRQTRSLIVIFFKKFFEFRQNEFTEIGEKNLLRRVLFWRVSKNQTSKEFCRLGDSIPYLDNAKLFYFLTLENKNRLSSFFSGAGEFKGCQREIIHLKTILSFLSFWPTEYVSPETESTYLVASDIPNFPNFEVILNSNWDNFLKFVLFQLYFRLKWCWWNMLAKLDVSEEQKLYLYWRWSIFNNRKGFTNIFN